MARVEAHHVCYHQEDIGVCRGGYHFISLSDVATHRFLHEDMFAGGSGGKRYVAMGPRVDAYVNRVNIVSIKERAIIGISIRTEAFGLFSGGDFVDVGDGDNVTVPCRFLGNMGRGGCGRYLRSQ